MANSNSLNKKIATVLILIIACIAVSMYFQSVGIESVYTHLFYIPIIVSCIWWQEKGIIIAFLLGLTITVCHLIFQKEVPILNDALRSIIFIIMAILVSTLSAKEKKKSILLKQEIKKVKRKTTELETTYKALREKNKAWGKQYK